MSVTTKAQTNDSIVVFYGSAHIDSMYGEPLNKPAYLKVTLELSTDSLYNMTWNHNLAQYFNGMDSTCFNSGKYFIWNGYLFISMDENENIVGELKCNLFAYSMFQEESAQTLTKKESKALDEMIRIYPTYYYLRIVDEDKIYFNFDFDVLEEVWKNQFIKMKRSTTIPKRH